jgi:hypothetical protein
MISKGRTCTHNMCCCFITGPSAFATAIHEDKTCGKCFPKVNMVTDDFELWALKVRRDRIMKPVLWIVIGLTVLGAMSIVAGLIHWVWHDPTIPTGVRIALSGLFIGVLGGLSIPVTLSAMDAAERRARHK